MAWWYVDKLCYDQKIIEEAFFYGQDVERRFLQKSCEERKIDDQQGENQVGKSTWWNRGSYKIASCTFCSGYQKRAHCNQRSSQIEHSCICYGGYQL